MIGSEDDSTVSRSQDISFKHRPMEARLTAVYPPDIDWQIELGGDRIEIGRGGTPSLRHKTVSRRHLAVEWSEGWKTHVGIELGSHNGSRIDAAQLALAQQATLHDGSLVQVGDILMIYERGSALSAHDPAAVSLEAIPGDAAVTRALRAAVACAAPNASPVLLIGETGTGKEWIAREIHRLSARRGALVAVNCAALSPELIESELFGHIRGSFTGATGSHEGLFRAASTGTLFLDEIGELPPPLQPKLLRALQESKVQPVGSTRTVDVDVRIIAATNRDLAAEVDGGRFRRDLFARLALWEVRVPALRERRVDLLAWIGRMARVQPRAADLRFSPDAASAILEHAWPDNLRGIARLLHAIELSAHAGDTITRDELPRWIHSEPAASESAASGRPAIPDAPELERVLAEHDYNLAAVARHFGRDRRQIYRWLERHGMPRTRS